MKIGPFPQWSDAKKIVSMDPLGHLAPWLFQDIIKNENGEYRPPHSVERMLTTSSRYQTDYWYVEKCLCDRSRIHLLTMEYSYH